MPSYLDFNSTKKFRDFVISKTLNRPNGPQSFTEANYPVQNLNEFPNKQLGNVDTNRAEDLKVMSTNNVYKPLDFMVRDSLTVLPRKANLELYPYFKPQKHNLIGIMSNKGYESESELIKFASNHIRTDKLGPVHARLQHNLYTATSGKNRLMDALNGNTATAINLITGREPLIEKNYKITTSKTLAGKAIDFLGTVAGVEFPFTDIPGDYLSNPMRPTVKRPEAKTGVGKAIQDVTGAIGSLFGIQRRANGNRNPSDLFIEYMGEGQRQVLYDQLAFSKYAPNYTTSARSQQSSKLFQFGDHIAQGVKTVLGLEAPRGRAYIGDDRGEDVYYAMNDFNDRVVRGGYYLSLMFDPVQTRLFERTRRYGEGGEIGGKLTWYSPNSKNKLGLHNEQYSGQSSHLEESLSTKHDFRDGSLLGYTQELLDSMPKDGASAMTHVGNVIDQTSRIFKEGDTLISRASAVKYVDKFGGETGAEFCRVWTKDRPYLSYSDTMKRTGLIRKYPGSVMKKPWDISIAPTYGSGGGLDAKRFMLSIENLAWRTSNTPGFMVSDLPECERGSNGGRVMWFPPYGLKVTESNSTTWNPTTFLGRPEPIYTYGKTERTGTLSFKVVVDHPSILNLLVKEHFKNMSDEETENYLHAFFAGCEELDFFDLIKRYATLSKSDIELLRRILQNGGDPETIKTYKVAIPDPVSTTVDEKRDVTKVDAFKGSLKFENDIPPRSSNELVSGAPYSNLYESYKGKKGDYENKLRYSLTTLLDPAYNNNLQAKKEREMVFNTSEPNVEHGELINKYVTDIGGEFDKLAKTVEDYTTALDELKKRLEEGEVGEITLHLLSSTSSVASVLYNEKLSLRRTHSVLQDVFNKISKDGNTKPEIKWISNLKEGKQNENVEVSKSKGVTIKGLYELKDFGYEGSTAKINIVTESVGETFGGNEVDKNCVNKDFVLVKELKEYSPIAFYCRQTNAEISYEKVEVTKGFTTTTESAAVVTGVDTVKKKLDGPQIDALKMIVMRVLSECHYFKKIEESTPTVFASLKEKLQYFHPAFHSTTPEGLNSRLTFLLQCLRPGDTIPVIGVADDLDKDARNTSFGPPPVCVLRIGDFYHSKVIIRNVNFTYEESTWDLNPEGIGVQPMLVDVVMDISFMGGQGLSKPVERLQNALSSNFFANTEVYDERAIATMNPDEKKEYDKFSEQFLESLQSRMKTDFKDKNAKDTSINKIEGTTVGVQSGDKKTISYTELVGAMYKDAENYFKVYESTHKNIITKHGESVGSILLSSEYRKNSNYQVFATTSPTPSKTIKLFGLYDGANDARQIGEGLKRSIITKIKETNLCELFGIDRELGTEKVAITNESLSSAVITIVNDKIGELHNNSDVKTLEEARNKLIGTMDSLNFVVKHGKDVKLDKDDAVEVMLSGFTYNLLYNEYAACVDYIEKNGDKYALNPTVRLTNQDLSNNEFKAVLSDILNGKIDDVMAVFSGDDVLYNDRLKKGLRKKMEKFVKEPKEPNVKLKKFPVRKNQNALEFNVLPEKISTNASLIEDAKKLFTTKAENTNKVLNYLR